MPSIRPDPDIIVLQSFVGGGKIWDLFSFISIGQWVIGLAPDFHEQSFYIYWSDCLIWISVLHIDHMNAFAPFYYFLFYIFRSFKSQAPRGFYFPGFILTLFSKLYYISGCLFLKTIQWTFTICSPFRCAHL